MDANELKVFRAVVFCTKITNPITRNILDILEDHYQELPMATMLGYLAGLVSLFEGKSAAFSHGVLKVTQDAMGRVFLMSASIEKDSTICLQESNREDSFLLYPMTGMCQSSASGEITNFFVDYFRRPVGYKGKSKVTTISRTLGEDEFIAVLSSGRPVNFSVLWESDSLLIDGFMVPLTRSGNRYRVINRKNGKTFFRCYKSRPGLRKIADEAFEQFQSKAGFCRSLNRNRTLNLLSEQNRSAIKRYMDKHYRSMHG